MKVAVGNLAKEATEEHLRALFEIFGKVSSIQIRRSGEAHVDMPNTNDARRAIEGLNGQRLLEYAMELREIDEHRGPPRGKPRRRKRR
ncbi:MAG: RNA-binding protein [Gemmatimonadota bacterium]